MTQDQIDTRSTLITGTSLVMGVAMLIALITIITGTGCAQRPTFQDDDAPGRVIIYTTDDTHTDDTHTDDTHTDDTHTDDTHTDDTTGWETDLDIPADDPDPTTFAVYDVSACCFCSDVADAPGWCSTWRETNAANCTSSGGKYFEQCIIIVDGGQISDVMCTPFDPFCP